MPFVQGEFTVETPQAQNLSDQAPREERYISHALAELRKFKKLPFFCRSAVLLDLSRSGFKIELTGEYQIIPGSQYWLNIPLNPLGIYSPQRLVARVECKWFDERRYRVGGIFLDLSQLDQLIIEQIVAAIRHTAH